MKGIDVSVWNGDIDWHAVKSAGFDFAICRSSYGDKHFDYFCDFLDISQNIC